MPLTVSWFPHIPPKKTWIVALGLLVIEASWLPPSLAAPSPTLTSSKPSPPTTHPGRSNPSGNRVAERGIHLQLQAGWQRSDFARGVLLTAPVAYGPRLALGLLQATEANALGSRSEAAVLELLHLGGDLGPPRTVRSLDAHTRYLEYRDGFHLRRLVVRTQGKVATCYGLWSPLRDLQAWRLREIRGILNSAHLYTPPYSCICEPRQAAFRLAVPEGWKADLRVVHQGDSHFLWFALHSRDGRARVVGEEPHQTLYVAPGAQLDELGLHAGANYQPVPGTTLMIRPVPGATSFYRTTLARAPGWRNLRLTSEENLPDLAQSLSRPTGRPDPHVRLQGQAVRLGLSNATECGEALVAIQRYAHDEIDMQGWVAYTRMWAAPQDSQGKAREAFEAALASLEVNPSWWQHAQAGAESPGPQTPGHAQPSPTNLLVRTLHFRTGAGYEAQAPVLHLPWWPSPGKLGLRERQPAPPQCHGTYWASQNTSSAGVAKDWLKHLTQPGL